MTTTLTHAQIILLLVLGAVWVWFSLWIYWMLFRVLRWTYLEKKQAHRWTPPVETPENVYHRR